MGRPRTRHWGPLHVGRTQQSAPGWAGPWPAGRSVGGWTEAGGAPHPLSCFPPPQRPITRQAPAPGVASRGPATPKRRVFAGKKSEQLAARRAVVAGWALRIAGTPALGPGLAGGANAIPSRARCAGRRVVRAAAEVSSGALGMPARAGGWGTRRSRRGDLAGRPGAARDARPAWAHACPAAALPAGGLWPCPRRGSAPRNSRLPHSRAELPGIPAGVAPAVRGEGPASRRGGCQAPRLRARRPAIQLSRPSPISRALSSPGASGPMGSERGGAAGRRGANDRGGPSEGGGTWREGPLGRSRGWGWAWARRLGPRRREDRGVPGPWVGVRAALAGSRDLRGAEVSRAACPGVAGTGQPVAMATVGRPRRARARGAAGGLGHRGVGGSLVSGGVLPLRPHLLEFPGT